MIDKGTYGGSKASATLERILKERPEYIKRVCKHFHYFTRDLNVMRSVRDRQRSIAIVDLIRRDRIAAIKAERFPADIQSYLLNTLAAFFKMWIKEKGGTSDR